jgi:hypothetical protein
MTATNDKEERRRVVREAIFHFLATEADAFVRGFIVSWLYPDPRDVEEWRVDDIADYALTRAAECRWPPRDVSGVRPWFAIVTRRAIAKHYRELASSKRRSDHSVDVVEVGDRRAEATDRGAREHLLCKNIEPVLDDPVKRQSFEMMFEKNLWRFSLAEMGAKYLKTPNGIEARIRKLRRLLVKKLLPRIGEVPPRRRRRRRRKARVIP